MKETDQNKSNKMQVQKLPTGIEGFDDVCRVVYQPLEALL